MKTETGETVMETDPVSDDGDVILTKKPSNPKTASGPSAWRLWLDSDPLTWRESPIAEWWLGPAWLRPPPLRQRLPGYWREVIIWWRRSTPWERCRNIVQVILGLILALLMAYGYGSGSLR